MSTLVIDNKTLTLSQQGECIKIASDESGPKTIPFSHIKRVVISSNVNIQSRLLRTLASKDISVAFINPRKPQEYGLLQGSGHNDAARKIRQLKASQSISTCRQISCYLVIEKITAQHQMLKQAAPDKAQCQYAIIRTLPVLENALQRLQSGENLELNTIRGLEGSAAAAYFNAYKCLFPESFNFTHRNRRPPRDPVNALLSLSYTLADSIACQRLQSVGLELMIGFYHQLSWSRHSLSSDVIEPVRPQIDEWVRLLIARQHIRIHHFEQNDDACLLKKQGRQIYYALWEQEIRSQLTKMIDDCIRNIDSLMGEKNG
jgi:CRISPR-associated protein Cas1